MKVSQHFLTQLFGVSEVPYCAEFVRFSPTFECPEDCSYELVYDRAFTIEDQAHASVYDFQDWYVNEAFYI